MKYEERKKNFFVNYTVLHKETIFRHLSLVDHHYITAKHTRTLIINSHLVVSIMPKFEKITISSRLNVFVWLNTFFHDLPHG